MSEVVTHHHSQDEKPLSLSDSAMRHLVKFLDKEGQAKGVRLSVKKTGCSGLSYVIDYVVEGAVDDIVEALNEKYQIYIDRKSFPYLKGIHMDYVTQGLNSKFVFKNPNQTGQCGCGESFTVNDDR